ncbi:haloacid dehalogenase-like hydrolase domain-containing 5 isoform X2 [Eurytemora carolleeae]|uniref:haloacid dehalogenase-like hydrolase domain-containing 5 isoform X2 n=1 Tax=Eurytemora carolleeae TaxID=1294199 RepID=UPI000C78E76E|nr:haloacid dehalogenase-like hydrolase domain-containing 5 isoform X2 [Eurytemora carolleeae]|eukprot:XP_023320757.1 haloacid dehalogenase-like hydrolase domain-containing 5 isoform X2 [Eurytemora affinis]
MAVISLRKSTCQLFQQGGARFDPLRVLSSRFESTEPNFGIMFDIDGVIVRGRTVLPFAPEAFSKLFDQKTQQFKIPSVFVTNAGNSIRQEKADKLSEWLNIPITEDQVVMAHSPLRMFNEFHNKHVLVTGQGPVEFIARNLGFKKVTTMDQLRHAFPALDAVDHKRRRAAACAFEKYFPRIEAVVLFGEPVRWETSLQLLIDVLLSDGQPSAAPEKIVYPHLPILACNMDLQWMAEAVMPRFGHGAFLLCLENLYKKVTGHELVYTALVGKPSEITYRHSEHVLQEQALKIGLKKPVRHIYCIGDNICTDIFGANLYNKYLQRARDTEIISQNIGHNSRSIDNLLGTEGELKGATSCYSILVETGVFSRTGGSNVSLDHSPRDFLPVENSYQEPTFSTENVLGAVDLIFEMENYKKNDQ